MHAAACHSTLLEVRAGQCGGRGRLESCGAGIEKTEAERNRQLKCKVLKEGIP